MKIMLGRAIAGLPALLRYAVVFVISIISTAMPKAASAKSTKGAPLLRIDVHFGR